MAMTKELWTVSKYTLEVNRFPNTDPRLGRHVNHDSRNRYYAVGSMFISGMATSAQYHSSIPVLDQGQIGACTGFAGAGLMGYGRYFSELPLAKQNALLNSGNATGLTFYHTATTLDNISGTYPPNDTGSDGPSSAKGMTQLGYANGYKHSFTYASFLTALNTGPVMVGTTWYNSMFDTSGADGTVNIDTRSGVAGGHEYVADGYDSNWVYFLNSWGTSFGNKGHFRIAASQFSALLADQGDVTVPVPLTAPAPVPVPPVPAPTPIPVLDTDVRAAYSSLKGWAKRNNVS